MNTLDYYNRQKEVWEDKEIQELKNEYENNKLTISEIADIHRRTPGSISCKLKAIGAIYHSSLCRCYFE
jgi:hypothetical protein